jgi:nucleoside-diphosphate-sugar epimerase
LGKNLLVRIFALSPFYFLRYYPPDRKEELMNKKNPLMIITGASGVVGKPFIEAVKEEFSLIAVARRSQEEANVPPHPNIKWLQVDVAHFTGLKSTVMNALGGNTPGLRVDFILHLASYYDFTYTDHPEYERTNVQGTRNVLELAKELKVKRFVFASSLAAHQFPVGGEKITEKSPVDGKHPYARTKRAGEALVKEFSAFFPCTVVRSAAVFTDWCEYGHLYMMMSRWLSRKLEARILDGKGEASIPYIHTEDLNKFLLAIFKKSDELADFDIYIASPDHSPSHRELFETAVKFYFTKKRKPVLFPRALLAPVVIARDFLGCLVGKRPYERPWMLKYIDLKLETDSSYSRRVLGWEPTPRLHILRRLLYLVEKMKLNSEEWHFRNANALKRIPQRPNLLLYDVMVKLNNELIPLIETALLNPGRKDELSHYQKINPDNFHWDISVFYQLLTASVRNKDRMLLMNYASDLLSPIRFSEGFNSREVCTAILETGKIVISRLVREPELENMEELIHDYIVLTIQLTVDEVENAFERLSRTRPTTKVPQRSDIEEKLKELATFCTREESAPSSGPIPFT